MSAEQLELNLFNESEEDFKHSTMQKRIDMLEESLGKMRRKLFAELNEVKRENEKLRQTLQDFKNEKNNQKTDTFFDVSEYSFK